MNPPEVKISPYVARTQPPQTVFRKPPITILYVKPTDPRHQLNKNQKPGYGNYALLDEAMQDEYVLEHALKEGISIALPNYRSFVNPLDKTPPYHSATTMEFLTACAAGDKQTVTKLVKEYPHLVDSAETLISGNRGLHEAVMNGRTEICNVLLKGCKALPNIANKYCQTPLHIAAYYDTTSCIQILLEYRGNLRCRDEKGKTPKQVATERKSNKFLKALELAENGILELVNPRRFEELKNKLESGINPNFTNSDGISLLYVAVLNSFREIVEFLLRQKVPVDANTRDRWGRAPLHIAVDNGDVEMVTILVNYGLHDKMNPERTRPYFTNVNVQDYGMWTPLHIATLKKDINIVKELMKDPTLQLDLQELFWGATALHIASLNDGSREIAEILMHQGARFDIKDWNLSTPTTASHSHGIQFLHACSVGSVETAARLLQVTGNINFQDPTTKDSGLHKAIENKHKNMIEWLLKNGASRTVVNTMELTPRKLAEKMVANNDTFGLDVLNIFGLCENLDSLFVAIEANNPTEVARLTTQSFPDANTRRQGITVLHKAADCGSLACMKLLFSIPNYITSTIIDAVSWKNGYTALHYAIQNGHTECARLLLEKGAAMDTTENVENSTALMLAVKNNQIKLVFLLLEFGSPLHKQNKYKKTALDIAYELDFIDIAHLLRWYTSARELITAAAEGDTTTVLRILEGEKIRMSFETPDKHLKHVDGPSISLRDLVLMRQKLKENEAKAKEADVNFDVLQRLVDQFVNQDVVRSQLPNTKEINESLADMKAQRNVELLLNVINDIINTKPKHPINEFFDVPDLVNFKDKQGMTPLHHAVLTGRNCVAMLLNAGADIFAADKKNRTPRDLLPYEPKSQVYHSLFVHEYMTKLFAACREKDKDAVRKLIQSGNIDPNKRNGVLQTPVYVAALVGADECLALLLELKDVDVNIRANDGDTPLFAAVVGQNLRCVELLLANGADVTICDNDQLTPLQMARLQSSADIKRILMIADWGEKLLMGVYHNDYTEILKAKRKLEEEVKATNIKDSNRKTSMSSNNKESFEMSVDDAERIYYVIDPKTKANALQLAIIQRNFAIARKLIEEERVDLLEVGKLGVSFQQLAIDNQAPENFLQLIDKNEMGYKLLAATAIGDAEQVGKLIDNYPHLDINFYNHFRCCALHYAAFNNCIEVAKVLISSGAKIDCLDAELCTPMHYAAYFGNIEVLLLLMQKGAACDARNKSGLTPFVCALFSERIEVIRILARYSNDITAYFGGGHTVLHLAAQHKDNTILKEMLSIHKSNIDIKDEKRRETPLFTAVRYQRLENIALLINAGTNPLEMNQDDDCPLGYACARGMLEVVKALCVVKGKKILIHETNIVHLACLSGRKDVLEVLLQLDPELGKRVKAQYINFPRHHEDDKPLRSEHEYTPMQIAIAARKSELFVPLIVAGFQCIPHQDMKVVPNWKRETTQYLKISKLNASLLVHAKSGNQAELLNIIKFMEIYGLNINISDMDGNTPLHLAAKEGKAGAVHLLLRAGADAKALNNDKKMPIELAQENSNIVEYFTNPPIIEVFAPGKEQKPFGEDSDEEIEDVNGKDEESSSESEISSSDSEKETKEAKKLRKKIKRKEMKKKIKQRIIKKIKKEARATQEKTKSISIC